ncbi:MAG: hypothetical protein GX621_09255, partial [Pirellulaceae bacterium]|nr:hypothetical protein [Pirellulaceae bacterium]
MTTHAFHRLLVFSVLCALLAHAGPVAADPPSAYFKPNMPDLDQHRPGQLPQDGKYHCSPTSAANSLKWFTNHMGIG